MPKFRRGSIRHGTPINTVAASLQVWSPTFSRAFDSLPASVCKTIQSKVDEMGLQLESFAHKRLQGRSEFKLRVGDYRVISEFDVNQGRIYLHYVGHRRDIYRP
jgi:mRNA interferase RelE/StbE